MEYEMPGIITTSKPPAIVKFFIALAIPLSITSYLATMYMMFKAGEMHARSQETAWLVDRAHALEQRAAEDAARAQALLQGAQAESEKQNFVVVGKGNAGQVSSL